MLSPVYTNAFKRDIKRVKKRNLDVEVLKKVILDIVEEHPLASKHKNHKLIGNWKEHWECHLGPDWLLIYRFQGEDVIFERTGSHSDLF
jgi:mRNA interferase YafQ